MLHITANAVDGVHLFRDEIDRWKRFELLLEETTVADWRVLAYCQMTTHEHLLLETTKATLSTGFQRLQSRYARLYNARHGRRGALWQRRFHSQLVETEWHLFASVRYIALNPVRARMVERAEDWEWSSYGAAIGLRERDTVVDERSLLKWFGRDRAISRRRLRALVETASGPSQRRLGDVSETEK